MSYVVKINYFYENLLLYSQAQIRQTEGIPVMMFKEGSTKIVNFMTPKAGILVLGRAQISHIVKKLNFFKNHLLLTQAYIRQIESIVMVTKEDVIKLKIIK